MLKIAICDDEEYIVDKIESCVLRFGIDKHIEFKVYKFYNGEALVNSDVKFNLVFLDIKMHGLDGLEVGKLLKERDMTIPIVYITSFADESQRAHRVHAFDFVVKPFEYENIEVVLRDFKKLDKKTRDDFIQVRTGSGDELIQNTDEILYFEYKGQRNIIIKTFDEEIPIKGNLYEIYDKLDKSQFTYTHKGYIVNLMQVKSIAKGLDKVYLKDGSDIPLSYKKRIEFKESLHNFMRV
ncbi:MAG: response regulator transcription factor [Oscillospiraceae bacterium]|nr:response regulator transcription factor [Oscillospiraceae bacterium]